tara:strand:+ start:347 stop:526 length:180 start_codon:yes stop_codon:yes gene_type:complete
MNQCKKNFLKKGQGKLASNYHGKTNFSIKRTESIRKEQNIREKQWLNDLETQLYNLKNY